MNLSLIGLIIGLIIGVIFYGSGIPVKSSIWDKCFLNGYGTAIRHAKQMIDEGGTL